jgi:hypothetical protein
MFMEISRLKKAEELKPKYGKFLSTSQFLELASKKIVPHYILINPLTGEESIWFQSSEVDAWFRRYFRSINEMPQSELIFLNFKTNEYRIEPHDKIPDELCMIKNLCKLPMVRINTPPGVYFLCQERDIVYIGKAVNIADRIVEHKKEAVKKFDSVYFICCHSDQLTQIETACIRFFKPAYNISAVKGNINEAEQNIITKFLGVSVNPT